MSDEGERVETRQVMPQHSPPSSPASQRQVAAPVAVTSTGIFSNQPGVDSTLLAHIVSATISSPNLPSHPKQPCTSQPSIGKNLKASDLPTLKGYTLYGTDGSAFLDSLYASHMLASAFHKDNTC
jgi:hypothetical protein